MQIYVLVRLVRAPTLVLGITMLMFTPMDFQDYSSGKAFDLRVNVSSTNMTMQLAPAIYTRIRINQALEYVGSVYTIS